MDLVLGSISPKGYAPETVVEEKASQAISDIHQLDELNGFTDEKSAEIVESLSLAYFALSQVSQESLEEFSNKGFFGKASDIAGLS